ncbi:MAG: hypothetical protein WCI43_02270 [Candidatus Firestonebacteria bacterium]
MDMRTMIVVGGSAVFLLIIISSLMGLKIIKASVKVHGVLALLAFLFILPHTAIGWIYMGPKGGVIIGTLLVLILGINILSGSGKIKLSKKAHIGLGIAALVLALLHGGGNILEKIIK